VEGWRRVEDVLRTLHTRAYARARVREPLYSPPPFSTPLGPALPPALKNHRFSFWGRVEEGFVLSSTGIGAPVSAAGDDAEPVEDTSSVLHPV
jgi:hypothetical protein